MKQRTFVLQVSTWGVFARPANISAAYGGGRTIRPGDYGHAMVNGMHVSCSGQFLSARGCVFCANLISHSPTVIDIWFGA